MFLNVVNYIDNTLTNGEGMRTAIFTSGCTHDCEGCHNRDLQDFKIGKNTKIEDILDRLKKNEGITKKRVTFSGGDPFFQAKGYYHLAKLLKSEGWNIWCYTGYTYEEIINSGNEYFIGILNNIDVLVDGKFDIKKTENALKYTGSSNQRIIDVKKSLISNNIVNYYI